MKFVKACAGLILAASLPLSLQAEEQLAQGPGMMGPGGGMMEPQRPRHGMKRPGMGMGQGMMTPRPFAGVQFNEEQRKRIQEMMSQERQTHQERIAKMREFQQQLQKLYSADKWDANAITKLYENMHAEQRKTITAMAKARNKVYDMMTREQREQMKKFQQEQMKRFSTPPQPPQPPRQQ